MINFLIDMCYEIVHFCIPKFKIESENRNDIERNQQLMRMRFLTGTQRTVSS